MSNFESSLMDQSNSSQAPIMSSSIHGEELGTYGLEVTRGSQIPMSDGHTLSLSSDLEVPPIVHLNRETDENSELLSLLNTELLNPISIPSALNTEITSVDLLEGQADLVAIAFDANTDRILRDGQSTVTFTLANQGTADTTSFSVNLVYSDTSILGDAEDIILTTLSFDGLAAGQHVTPTVDVQLPISLLTQRAATEDPNGLISSYVAQHRDYLGLVIDPQNNIAEGDEGNNVNRGQGKDLDDITYFPWDVDENGTVEPNDAIFVLNHLGQNEPRADANGDGEVTVADVFPVITRLGYQVNLEAIDDLNIAPIAVNDRFVTNENTELTGNVLSDNGNGVDSDVNRDTVTILRHTTAIHGSVTVNPDGSFNYTPNLNYSGPDTFEYTISDGQGGEDTATVAITVEIPDRPPSAENDFFMAVEDTPFTGNVLTNDSDPNGDAIQVVSSSNPQNGTLNIADDGSFTYTPSPDYFGPDSFTYTISDGSFNSTATVSLLVMGENDEPEAEDDNFTVGDVTSITRNVLINDRDVDGDRLTLTGVTQGANGRVVINSDGTLTYAPNPSFVGNDTFTYTVSDGDLTDTGTVNVSVEAILLFDNSNTAQVFNQPISQPTFSINRPATDLSRDIRWSMGCSYR